MVQGEGYTLIEGDCLEVMAGLDGPVDAIIADLPYGTTQSAWDVVIPLDLLWAQFKRLIKPNGAIVLFGSQPFTSELVMSNREWFRYQWIWHKSRPGGFLDANKKPLTDYEDISIFYAAQCTYHPQKHKGKPNHHRNGHLQPERPKGIYGPHGAQIRIRTDEKYPGRVLKFDSLDPAQMYHRNQKPTELLRYLIRTYTNPGETVLDCTMGSGTTIVAAIQEGRQGIGIDSDAGYFDIAAKRCADASRAARGLPKQIKDARRHDDLPLFMAEVIT